MIRVINTSAYNEEVERAKKYPSSVGGEYEYCHYNTVLGYSGYGGGERAKNKNGAKAIA